MSEITKKALDESETILGEETPEADCREGYTDD